MVKFTQSILIHQFGEEAVIKFYRLKFCNS